MRQMKTCACAFAAFSTLFANAATPYWVGGTSGDLSGSANWNPQLSASSNNECMMFTEGTTDYSLYLGSDFIQSRLNVHRVSGLTVGSDFDLRNHRIQTTMFRLYGVKATFRNGTIQTGSFTPGGQSQDGGKYYYGTDVTFSNIVMTVDSPTTGYGVSKETTAITAYDSAITNLPCNANGTNRFFRSKLGLVYGWTDRFGAASNILFQASDHTIVASKDNYALGRFADKQRNVSYVFDGGSVLTNMGGVYLGDALGRDVSLAMTNAAYAVGGIDMYGTNVLASFCRTPFNAGYDRRGETPGVNLRGLNHRVVCDNDGEDFVGTFTIRGDMGSVLIKGARYGGSGIWYGSSFVSPATGNEVCFEDCVGIATNAYVEMPAGTVSNALVSADGTLYIAKLQAFNGTGNKVVATKGGEVVFGGSNWPQLMTGAGAGGCALRIEGDGSRITFTPDKQNLSSTSAVAPLRFEFKPGPALFNGTAPLTFTTVVKSGPVQVVVDAREALVGGVTKAKIPIVRSSVASGLAALETALAELNGNLVTEPAGGTLTMESGILYCTVRKPSGFSVIVR